jgi:hypothetical protein
VEAQAIKIMNGERPQVNGQHLANGTTSTQHHQATEAKIARSSASSNGNQPKSEPIEPYINGVHQQEEHQTKGKGPQNGVHVAPAEILELVSRDHYLPLATLINRRTKTTWHGLSRTIDALASTDVKFDNPPPGVRPNNTSDAMQKRKERFLLYLKHQREDFVKLLVLLRWCRDYADTLPQVISINNWIALRRQAYWNACAALAGLKRGCRLSGTQP